MFKKALEEISKSNIHEVKVSFYVLIPYYKPACSLYSFETRPSNQNF